MTSTIENIHIREKDRFTTTFFNKQITGIFWIGIDLYRSHVRIILCIYMYVYVYNIHARDWIYHHRSHFIVTFLAYVNFNANS